MTIFGPAELAVMAALDLAAEGRADGLLAVADAQHRHPDLEDRRIGAGGLLLGGAGRAAGQDDRRRLEAVQQAATTLS
jgi:hypothetical protein